ncbi:MAG TPA: amidase [Acidimicrobiales bacterium]|nr:amidase [Acidimicrobiales bacterium]
MGTTIDPFTSATELAGMLRGGTVSATELAELYLARIDELNPKLDAYLTVCADEALAAATAVDRGETTGPFAGVPISIKDLNDTRGVRTTHGTAEWSERIPDRDDAVVARIRAAGFVILGKTNTPEFGKKSISENPAYPPARNPWDVGRTPGGSSGGAAAALAAGLCPISQGSDGGGSIRIPASLCGVFGLKPSRGRVSTHPRLADPHAIDGPITRTVADAAALLDAISGSEVGDEWTAPPPERPFADEVGRDPGRLRVALTVAPFINDVDVSDDAVAATRDAAELLESLGHTVTEAAPPWDNVVAEQVVNVFAVNAAANASEPGFPSIESLDVPSRVLVTMGQGVTATAYIAARRAVHALSVEAHRFLEDYDVLLTPTVPIPPLPVGAFDDNDQLSEWDALLRSRALAAYTPIANLIGAPAVSVPLAWDGDGLPIGIHFVAGMHREGLLLRLSSQLEDARPWKDRRPPVT